MKFKFFLFAVFWAQSAFCCYQMDCYCFMDSKIENGMDTYSCTGRDAGWPIKFEKFEVNWCENHPQGTKESGKSLDTDVCE